MTAYEELQAMIGDDDRVARALLEGLRQLRDRSPDPEMRRFAGDVLDGRVSLREAARSEAYDAVLSRHFRGLTHWRDHLDGTDPAG